MNKQTPFKKRFSVKNPLSIKNQLGLTLFVMAALSTHSTLAKETGYLLQNEGFSGDILGAQIDSIEILSDKPAGDSNKGDINGARKITVNIPELPESIKSVEVLNKEGKLIPQKKRYEIINDLDSNRSGVIIYIGRKQTLPFKINFIEGGMADE